ncbi:hypothetical protein ACPXCE_17300 [Streptomyces sp. DT24]|uniref:hypothetical protein n=1 Tax=Streptomyces sp. DT24 TaxID=3416520 RepID=UPI003CEDB44C
MTIPSVPVVLNGSVATPAASRDDQGRYSAAEAEFQHTNKHRPGPCAQGEPGAGDAAGRAEQQHALARARPGAAEEHAPGRDAGDGQRGVACRVGVLVSNRRAFN